MKNFYIKTIKGVALIEILIVIAVMSMLLAVTAPQFSKIKEDQVLKTAVSDVLSSINKARTETLSSLNSSEYGVHFQSDAVIIFKGVVFLPEAATNEVISITAPASITNVAFGGGSSTAGDVYFNRLYEVPSTTGTVTIATPSFSKTITISATGVVSSN